MATMSSLSNNIIANIKMCKNANLELTLLQAECTSCRDSDRRCIRPNVRRWVGERAVRVERQGAFHRWNSQGSGVSRNTVRRYLRSRGVPQAKPRAKRGSKLDPYTEYIDTRLSEGLENCVVLLREIRGLGYPGGYSTLKSYVHPRRRQRQPKATVRFETGPGEQAQVDWGSFSYITEDGRRRRMWAFVMVLGFSRAVYVEFVRRADVATFIRCHLNAFEYFGEVPSRCLYDNAKVVVIGRDDEDRPEFNSRMEDFALRLGFELRLCRPYRAQTKGKWRAV